MSSKAVITWHKIFSRHVQALNPNVELSSSELRTQLKSLIELVGLRWAMHLSEPKKSVSNTLDPLAPYGLGFALPNPATSRVSSSTKLASKPREGGEECPWWDRKTRYQAFTAYAKAIILRAANRHNYRSQVGEKSSDLSFYKAVAKMAHRKVSWKKLPEAGSEKSFAAAVLFILDPKGDVEAADRHPNGLSHLLAQLERALGMIGEIQ